jgi:uncharacterized protein
LDIKLPDISDAFKPLPRLKSLVITELDTIRRNTPIDTKVFSVSFIGAFAFLLLLAFTLPLLKPKPVVITPEVVAVQAPPPPTAEQQKASEINDAAWNEPLTTAPIKELEEIVGDKTLPIRSPDGLEPWAIYARPYDKSDNRPKIVLVITGLGLSQAISQSAITDLPGPITLAFSNFSSEPGAWMTRARQLGHEVLLDIPMEPLDFPASDPGPDTLLSHNTTDENNALLLKHLANGKGYIGLTSLSGSRITTTPDKLKPVLEELKKRGLMWLDANLTPLSASDLLSKEVKLPSAKADMHINENMGAAAITKILSDAEASATQHGHSIIIIQPSPLAISLLRDWSKKLSEKHLSLAPLSSIAE